MDELYQKGVPAWRMRKYVTDIQHTHRGDEVLENEKLRMESTTPEVASVTKSNVVACPAGCLDRPERKDLANHPTPRREWRCNLAKLLIQGSIVVSNSPKNGRRTEFRRSITMALKV
ncbi:sugar transporter [Colletotrichum tofieldiae]|nr:sugar transporter [Colletotrichum tofieldiae]GKT73951.1 sugar transporter [Colletotrichum tofieldiae]